MWRLDFWDWIPQIQHLTDFNPFGHFGLLACPQLHKRWGWVGSGSGRASPARFKHRSVLQQEHLISFRGVCATQGAVKVMEGHPQEAGGRRQDSGSSSQTGSQPNLLLGFLAVWVLNIHCSIHVGLHVVCPPFSSCGCLFCCWLCLGTWEDIRVAPPCIAIAAKRTRREPAWRDRVQAFQHLLRQRCGSIHAHPAQIC